MKWHRNIMIGGVAVVCFGFSAQADTLSIKDYIRLALQRNPQQKIEASIIASTSASVQVSRSNLLPQISGKAAFSRSESPDPGARPQPHDVNSFSAGINGDMTLYDFGANRFHYKASGKSLEAAKYDSQSSMASLILNARSAYFNYLLSQRLLTVNEDALKQANLHVNQAMILVEVGKQARIEVTKSRVDAANAEVNVIHAKNTIALAKLQMEVVAGCELADPLALTDSLGAFEDTLALSDALIRANQKRPELLSLQAGIEANRLQLSAARAALYPSINANGSVGWGARDNAEIRSSDFSSAPNWTVGAALSVPIYQGGRLNALCRQSQASLRQAEAQLDAMKLTVGQQVRQYFLQEKEALMRIAATKTLIDQAEESLKLSQERFRAGVAYSLEITDAEVTLATARQSHAQAQYDYHIAHANLLLTTGSLGE
jgi:outer membrane protein